ncbi:general substrate transporter [Cristinia sonorae]|uniref:General substrate transporter n=1 Tax=Cristinia sonorae TaxID=1940300 RepID=A0A8K0XUT3_9AGAR|nr:general substrate transporter [Cristinia sonorae]
MGGPAAIAGGSGHGYAHLIDQSKPWYKNRRIMTLNAWMVLLLITSSTNGFDGSMMNGLQSLDQWKQAFNYPSGGMLGLLNAIQNIGCLAAYPFSPYISDGMGRRFAVALGAVIMCIATVLQTASNSVGMFIGARFMIGFGLTFSAAAAPVLITEVSYPTLRGPSTSLYNSLWFLGSIIAAWTTYGTFNIQGSWSWRVPSAIQGLPSVLQVLLIWFVPESPRWLCSKGRESEALQILAYYHADGNAEDPLVEYEFEEIKAAIKFDKEVAANVGWKSLIMNKGNRKRLRIMIGIAFFSQWSGNNLISYYMNKVLSSIGIIDPTTQLLINGILNIYNFIIAIGAGLLCDKIGRRPLFIASTIGMFVFWTIQTACFAVYSVNGNLAAAHTFIAMIFLFYAFYDIAFTPLIVSYTVEILPFALRAKGFTVFNFALTISLIFNQYVNPIALEKLGWKYYLVYVCWLAFESVFIWMYLIETKGRTLEETAALFDGDDSAAKISEVAARNANVEMDLDPVGSESSSEKDKVSHREVVEEVKRV